MRISSRICVRAYQESVGRGESKLMRVVIPIYMIFSTLQLGFILGHLEQRINVDNENLFLGNWTSQKHNFMMYPV